MSIRAKMHKRIIVTNPVVVSASDVTATTIATFNIEGMFDFTLTVHSSETACTFPYVIQTAPVNQDSYYTAITATSVVAGTAGGVTKNTFEGNNQAWLRVVLTSATDAMAAGVTTIILSGNER